MFVGSGTPQQLYSVIPKQNGEELPEQQIFTSLVFSTHLLLPRARPRTIKGLLKCGLKGLLKCGIKAWDGGQLSSTCTRRISLLSTPRPRVDNNDILLVVGFNYSIYMSGFTIIYR